jgi:hypothetical protein
MPGTSPLAPPPHAATEGSPSVDIGLLFSNSLVGDARKALANKVHAVEASMQSYVSTIDVAARERLSHERAGAHTHQNDAITAYELDAFEIADKAVKEAQRSLMAATTTRNTLIQLESKAKTNPAVALGLPAPLVGKYLTPFANAPVARSRLVVFLKPSFEAELTIQRVLAENHSLRVISRQQGDKGTVLWIERERTPGPIQTLEEVQSLETTLEHLESTGQTQGMAPEELLYAAADYTAVDTCIRNVMAGEAVQAPQPCLQAAARLRIPSALAVIAQSSSDESHRRVAIGIVDVGFEDLSGPLVHGQDSHGDAVQRVIAFAIGKWQRRPPIEVTWVPAAASGGTVAGAGRAVFLGESVGFLRDLSDVDVVNVSLGRNDYAFSPPTNEVAIAGEARRNAYQQMIDGAVTFPKRLFVASAAGNDAGCLPGFRAGWSSPLNAATQRAVRVVAQMSPTLTGIDQASNVLDSPGLAAPSGTHTLTCPSGADVTAAETSFATPYVTAIAAMVATLLPSADGMLVREILDSTARDGVPDALQAVLCALTRASQKAPDLPWRALLAANRQPTPTDPFEILATGEGVVGGVRHQVLFGVDYSDESVAALAEMKVAPPQMPAVCTP